MPPGLKAGFYGNAALHSDFHLNLQSPTETNEELKSYLDAMAELEERKLASSTVKFGEEKRHMIDVEKIMIKNIVIDAFKGIARQL